MYYFTFIYLFALALLSNKIKDRRQMFYAFLPLFLIVILRYGVGADYFSYERIFYNIKLDDLDIVSALTRMTNIDILFKFISILAVKIGLSYHFFVSVLVTLLTYITLRWIKNNSPNFLLSVFLHFSMLFFYWNLSALRQGIVVSVSLYVYFNNKKEFSLKAKLITSFILLFMHPTAIIVPIIYFFSLINWNQKKLLLLLLISPISRIIFNPFTTRILTKLPIINKAIKYISYNSINYLSLPSLLRFTFIVVILWHYDGLVKKYPKQKIMFNFSLLFLIMYFYLPFSMLIGTRVTIFGYYLTIVIFPMILSLYNTKKYKLVVLSGIMLWSFVSFYNEYSKLLDRTKYSLSAWQLNFETVIQKNRNNFANGYAFYLQAEEENKDYFKDSKLSEKVLKEYQRSDLEESASNEFLSVYFPNSEKYGLIDNVGNVVKIPSFDRRQKVISNIREYSVGQYPYSTTKYRYIINKAPIEKDYEEVKDILLKAEKEKLKIENANLEVKYLDLSQLENYEMLDNYNVKTVEKLESFTYDSHPNISYLKLSTSYTSHYIVLQDDKPLVNKLYNRIYKINEKDIIVAKTSYTTDYISKNGDIIWYE